MANISNPGGAWPPCGSSPVIRWLCKQNSVGIRQLIHSSNMSRRGELAELDNGGKCIYGPLYFIAVFSNQLTICGKVAIRKIWYSAWICRAE